MSNVFGSISIAVAMTSALPAVWLAIRQFLHTAAHDAPAVIKIEKNGVEIRITGPKDSEDVQRIVDLLMDTRAPSSTSAPPPPAS
ncbi:hypothetical protein [Streptomyces sp. NRRL S-87]|uniref:hypothetical protein n=1 Tax=Streptomyces sp. NRRL S-87 TaxID=1463920 RepID=UPI0004C1CECD|nr:hypothetical protein [Streptomyces sp. NRRL S-87]